MINVFIAKGSEAGRSFVLNVDTALIGRGASNEICLNESSVSRRHAKIHRDNDQYFIEDLQSRNGTWINGNVIQSGVRVRVQEGVPIALGNVLVSLGEKCSPNRLPKEYSVTIQAPAADGSKGPTVTDRRGKQKRELELIYEISVELLASLELTDLCERVLASIFDCLKRIDSGFVFLFEPESGRLKKAAGRFRGETPARGYSRSLVRRVVKEGRAVMMPDTAAEKKADLSDSMERIGVRSVICMPLVSKRGTRGAIYLQSVNAAHSFRKNDLFFLTSLSAPIALAVENALLYAKSKRAEERLLKAAEHLEKEIMNRTSELTKAKDELEQLSITDGLSGLHNYRYLIHSLESEFRRSIRYDRSLSLLLMDIDYFKNLNDSYGHLCGDYVIKTVGQLLKSNVRSTDVVARYGGDELAVVLIETDTKSAFEVAEKINQAIRSHAFQWKKERLSVNLSIGLATTPAPGIRDVADLVDAADRALYQAKQAGRNAVFAFGQDNPTTKTGKNQTH